VKTHIDVLMIKLKIREYCAIYKEKYLEDGINQKMNYKGEQMNDFAKKTSYEIFKRNEIIGRQLKQSNSSDFYNKNITRLIKTLAAVDF
jgi:hypothetical protein